MVIDRQVAVMGWNRSSLNEEIRAIVQTDGGYRPLSVGLDQTVFSRSIRPTWALVLAIILSPTLVGLSLLLVRKSEQFTWTVRESHTGTTARVSGAVPEAIVDKIVAICGTGPTSVPTQSASVGGSTSIVPPTNSAILPAPQSAGSSSPGVVLPTVESAPQLSTAVVPQRLYDPEAPINAGATPQPSATLAPGGAWSPPDLIPPITPAASPASPAGPTGLPAISAPAPTGSPAVAAPAGSQPLARSLGSVDEATDLVSSFVQPTGGEVAAAIVLPDGTRRVLSGKVLVGRAPEPRPDETADLCIAIDDATVSKTHIAIEHWSAGLQITDRGSLNGTRITVPGRAEAALEPGTPFFIGVKATLRVGSCWLVVEEA